MNSLIKSKNNNTKIILKYYLIIIILTIYATYKNGYILFQKELINFISIFKPFLMVFLALFITYLINYIIQKLIQKKDYSLLVDYHPLYLTLLTLALPLNTNIIVFSISIIIFNILLNFIHFKDINYYAILKLLIILALVLINSYTYQTAYSLNIETDLSTIDIFFGKGIGGLATSNVLLLIICYLILSLDKTYKKEIPFIAFITYFIILAIACFIVNKPIILEVTKFISGEFIYAIIFIATIPHYSPLSRTGKLIYAIIIGILTFFINNLTNVYEGVFISIIIVNVLNIILQKLIKPILSRQINDK